MRVAHVPQTGQTIWPQRPIDRRRADLQQLLAQFRAGPQVLKTLQYDDQLWDKRSKPLRAHPTTRLPDHLECITQVLAVLRWATATAQSPHLRRVVQQPNRCFPMILCHAAKLAQYHTLPLLVCRQVSPSQTCCVLQDTPMSHVASASW